MLDQVRDRYADLRRDLIEWATRSETRLKTLKAVVLRGKRGIMYEKIQRSLSVTRRWVKELVGELRQLGVIETPGNPAFALVTDKKLRLLLLDILNILQPAEDISVPTLTGAAYEAAPSEGVGNPTPSGDSPPGESPFGSGG